MNDEFQGLSAKEFDNLSSHQKEQFATIALAWLCVYELFNPCIRLQGSKEIDTIKIILGEYRAK